MCIQNVTTLIFLISDLNNFVDKDNNLIKLLAIHRESNAVYILFNVFNSKGSEIAII